MEAKIPKEQLEVTGFSENSMVPASIALSLKVSTRTAKMYIFPCSLMLNLK